MNQTKITSLVILAVLGVLVLTVACDRRASSPTALLNDTSDVGDQQRDQEMIERSLGVLFSMENYPDLPGLVGEETLTAMVDRLNKWFQGKSVDASWSPDSQIESLSQLAAQNADAVEKIVERLHAIQGDTQTTSDSAPLSSQSQQLVEQLAALDEPLRTLVGKLETNSLDDLIAALHTLRTKWEQLASMGNVSDGAVRAFAKQLTDETQAAEMLARTLQTLADTLDTRSLRVLPSDMQSLKQAVWMRQISQWARGDSHREIDRAQALFDWTIRNIDLRGETFQVDDSRTLVFPTQEPWQTVILGRGTPADRAWVFVELLRQQRIEACLLSIPDSATSRSQLWCVGVLIEGELYLFLVQDGLPVPGRAGVVVNENGITIPDVATLREFVGDAAIRERIVRAGESPLTDQQLANITAHLVVTPAVSSAKMRLLEKECAGDFTMVLYTSPRETRERFGAVQNLSSVELWQRPITAVVESLRPSGVKAELMRPFSIPSMKTQKFALWRGRTLYIKGKITGQDSAASAWQDAITPDRTILDLRNSPVSTQLAGLDQMLATVNTMATYWLGHAAFSQGNWESARNYFEMRERLSRMSFSGSGRRYMLGRLDEREGKIDTAAELYRQSGHALRAQWLKGVSP
ncbi:MAG: tetratricopeptide repeat protein [Thermoguttaceae bacterium]